MRPADAGALLLLACCWRAVGAAESWSEASAAKLEQADAEQVGQRWEQALALYRESLDLSPNPPVFQQYVLQNNIGWSLFNMGDWANAEDAYRRALRVSATHPPTDHAYLNLASLYKAQGRTKALIKVYQAAIALTKQPSTYLALAQALMREFRVDDAAAALQEGLSIGGEGSSLAQEFHNYLGKVNAWRRRWSVASHHFIKSVDLGLHSSLGKTDAKPAGLDGGFRIASIHSGSVWTINVIRGRGLHGRSRSDRPVSGVVRVHAESRNERTPACGPASIHSGRGGRD